MVRSQKERLFAALIASTETKGYPATTVADLISLAGVSRATFYEHFDSKDGCFRSTLRELLGNGLTVVSKHLDGPGEPYERGEQALRSFLELIARQPAAARVCLVDAYSAGLAGLDPVGEACEEACELAHETLRMLPDRGQMPFELSRGVIGGFQRVVYRRLYRGDLDSLLSEHVELWRWASGFEPPPPEWSNGRRRHRSVDPSPQPRGRDRYERILRGFAKAVAIHGFPNVTVPQISAEAEISNATFYQHFENKDDAMLAALDLSGAQLTAAALPVARREAEWPQALGRAIEATCRFLASEPAFARLHAVEVYAAGPEALAHRDRAWDDIVAELVPARIREAPGPAPLALSASSGAIYALLYDRVRKDELDAVLDLHPLLTYIMLSPLLGAPTAVAAVGAVPAAGENRG